MKSYKIQVQSYMLMKLQVKLNQHWRTSWNRAFILSRASCFDKDLATKAIIKSSYKNVITCTDERQAANVSLQHSSQLCSIYFTFENDFTEYYGSLCVWHIYTHFFLQRQHFTIIYQNSHCFWFVLVLILCVIIASETAMTFLKKATLTLVLVY